LADVISYGGAPQTLPPPSMLASDRSTPVADPGLEHPGGMIPEHVSGPGVVVVDMVVVGAGVVVVGVVVVGVVVVGVVVVGAAVVVVGLVVIVVGLGVVVVGL